MIDDSSSRLMMSDSIKGQVPELESDETAKFDDGFVIVVIETKVDEASSDRLLVGSLVGFGHEDVVKIDLRVPIVDAFAVVKKTMDESPMTCEGYQMHLGTEVARQTGPFKLSSPRVMDFDHANKMCTLAVDLIRA